MCDDCAKQLDDIGKQQLSHAQIIRALAAEIDGIDEDAVDDYLLGDN